MIKLHNLIGLVPLAAALSCHPESPLVPRPYLTPSLLANATDRLAELFDSAISGEINAGWPVENTSFSVALASTDPDGASGVPLWEYHHLSENNPAGTKHLDRDSQYLIGSITKAVSAYILLVSGVDIDAPVTSYLPELAGESEISWGDVSLRMLASHLAGVPTNYGFSEYHFLNDVFSSLGFPSIPESDYAPCGVNGLNGPCTSQQLLSGLRSSHPITPPGSRPAYSNIAFSVIMLALEKETSKNYTELVDEMFAQPLGLVNTYPSPGDDRKGVVPPGDSSWGADFGFNAPGGGLVSSIADLTIFIHAILTRSLPISVGTWLKPSSFSGGMHSAAGMPWEITRHDDLAAHRHPVTITSKSGGSRLYRSHTALLDDYGLGIVILTAGPMIALPPIYEAVLAEVVPVVDEIARAQAKRQYAKTFSGRGVEAAFKMEGPSLVLESLNRNGSDIVKALRQIWSVSVGEMLGSEIDPLIRLFPTDLTEEVDLDGRKVMQDVWRLWAQLTTEVPSDLPSLNVLSRDCFSWTVGDWVHYGGEALDRVVFYRDDDGVVGFEAPFLRSGVLKPEC